MPNYPSTSRRQNEQGQVVLRVELDESGHISAARVSTSSGYKRLDEAGLAAIKNWQCNPSTRNGVAVRAIALQPFDFILEGR
jgi:protein TonB